MADAINATGADGEEWIRVFTQTAFATEYLHPALGPAWTAVLKEACCVRAPSKKEGGDDDDDGEEVAPPSKLRFYPPGRKIESDPYDVCAMHRDNFVDISRRGFQTNAFFCFLLPDIALIAQSMASSVAMLEFCIARGYALQDGALSAALMSGNIEVAEWVASRLSEAYTRSRPNFDVRRNAKWGVMCAYAGGHEASIAWIKDKTGFDAEESGCSKALLKHAQCAAAFGGHIDLLKRLGADGRTGRERSTKGSSSSKTKKKTKKEPQARCLLDAETCAYAAQGGQIGVLRYLHELGCPWNEWTVYNAAAENHLDVLRYAHENGCGWGSRGKLVCKKAIERGNLDMLKYLHEHGCPWDMTASVCAAAATAGRLDMLKYVRELGCPWDEHTCYNAAHEGHLDVIKYAHENGCPINEMTWYVRCRAERDAM